MSQENQQPQSDNNLQKADEVSTAGEKYNEKTFRFLEKDFMTFFLRKPKVGYLVAVFLLFLGAFTAIVVPKENFPNISFGQLVISTTYPGASAPDIDQLITAKIEKEIKGISGINKITSNSRNSFSSITVELKPDADTDKVLSDLRSEIDSVKATLPSEITSGPDILEINTALTPFISINLAGDLPRLELSEIADDLKEKLDDLSGVGQVSISGVVEREIFVDLNKAALDTYRVSVSEISRKLSGANNDVPLGDLRIDEFNYSLRFSGKFKNLDDLRNLEIRRIESTPAKILKLGELAQIYERAKDSDSLGRIFVPESQFVADSVTLSVAKNEGVNIFSLADSVRNQTNEFIEQAAPEVEVIFSQQADLEVKRSYGLLLNSVVSSILVVMLIIFVIVGFKEGLIAGIVIPLSFLMTIAVLYFLGSSLNFMTNFSMILALGILVDTAIVIVEGVHDYIKKGFSPYQAAIYSIHEFRQALISGTLTTLAVFLPLFSLPGTLGKFLTFIPITIFIVLTASLFISLFLIPLFAANFLKAEKHDKPDSFTFKTRQLLNRFFNAVIGAYSSLLEKVLGARFIRLGSLYLLVVAFFVSWLIPAQFVLFPSADANFFQIQASKQSGTDKEIMNEFVLPIEKELLGVAEIKNFKTTIAGNSVNIIVELIAKEDREMLQMRRSEDVVEDLQKRFESVKDADLRVENPEGGPPSEAPVAIRVIAQSAQSIDLAQGVAADFKEILEQIEGTSGVSDDIDRIPGEINFKINREMAAFYGVSPEDIFVQVRALLAGDKATVITRGKKDIDVVVGISDEKTDNLEKIQNFSFTAQSGELIPLSTLMELEINQALTQVKRIDGDIAFTVSSLLASNGNAQVITTEFMERIKNYEMPEGVTYQAAGENEENAELLVSLALSFVIAMLLMFLILVVQFDSLAQPLIILSTIIFANIGVNAGLWLSGTDRGLPVILGFIALAGVVVNDAIILLDQINKKKRETGVLNLEKTDLINVICLAARTRFNPIILTTLTTVAGIMPLIFVDTFWAGLSFTVIFGLLVASFLTLFITPIIYYQIEKEKVLTFVPPVVILVVLGALAAIAQLVL
jgi:multidrug efflux pump subunit AcrB